MNRAKRLLGILQTPDIATLRLLRGPYSQTELAEELHLKASTITRIERGRAVPQAGTIRALLEHFVKWTKALGWPSLELLTAAQANGKEQTTWRNSTSPRTSAARSSTAKTPPPSSSPARRRPR